MKTIMFLLAFSLVPATTWGDFSCPDATRATCLEVGDTVCPVSANCVADDAVCLDRQGCDSDRGYICGSQYDAVMNDYEKAVSQYNQLTSENVELRSQKLEQKNCVINAATLEDAIECVR